MLHEERGDCVFRIFPSLGWEGEGKVQLEFGGEGQGRSCLGLQGGWAEAFLGNCSLPSSQASQPSARSCLQQARGHWPGAVLGAFMVEMTGEQGTSQGFRQTRSGTWEQVWEGTDWICAQISPSLIIPR